jgi:DNA repair protein RadC
VDTSRLVQELRVWSSGLTREIAAVVPVRAGRLLPVSLIASGGVDRVSVSPADALAPVLRARAGSYILVHTHLLDVGPSAADQAVTRRLVSASAIVGVEMLAHLVLTPTLVHDCLSS